MRTMPTHHQGPARLRAYFITARQTGTRGTRDTMKALAQRCGVRPQTIWHITRGQPVSPALALLIEQHTGIDALSFPLGRGALTPGVLRRLLQKGA